MALTKPQGDMLLKLGTEQASTSGTAIDFTGIPSGTRQIVVMLEGVSTNGTTDFLVQIGDSGGVETTGYDSGTTLAYGTNLVVQTSSTVGFQMWHNSADSVWNGQMILNLKDATNNTWVSSHLFTINAGTGQTSFGAGVKSLSGVLDRVRITTETPDTFDAGSINIAYF